MNYAVKVMDKMIKEEMYTWKDYGLFGYDIKDMKAISEEFNNKYGANKNVRTKQQVEADIKFVESDIKLFNNAIEEQNKKMITLKSELEKLSRTPKMGEVWTNGMSLWLFLGFNKDTHEYDWHVFHTGLNTSTVESGIRRTFYAQNLSEAAQKLANETPQNFHSLTGKNKVV